uniref:Uncharacterized protein n=1 Tax=Arundo donax TaxID=35708 RepID=A0A0A9CCJ7_ARUDO
MVNICGPEGPANSGENHVDTAMS